jgi:hypothetical protein
LTSSDPPSMTISGLKSVSPISAAILDGTTSPLS